MIFMIHARVHWYWFSILWYVLLCFCALVNPRLLIFWNFFQISKKIRISKFLWLKNFSGENFFSWENILIYQRLKTASEPNINDGVSRDMPYGWDQEQWKKSVKNPRECVYSFMIAINGRHPGSISSDVMIALGLFSLLQRHPGTYNRYLSSKDSQRDRAGTMSTTFGKVLPNPCYSCRVYYHTDMSS